MFLDKNSFQASYCNNCVFKPGLCNTKKSLFCAFWAFILVSAIISVITLNFGVVHASTEVAGVIGSDTTWTRVDSPYSLAGNLLVGNGVTLTIEAGVTVNLNEYYIIVNGTLNAQGTKAKKIQFNGGEITFTHYSSDWDEQTGSGCTIAQSTLESTYVEVGSVSPKITNNSIWEIKVDGLANVSQNIIHAGITASGGKPTISNNSISGDVAISGGPPIISYNSILGEVDVPGGGGPLSAPVISNNIITGGDAGIKCNGYALISCNNISGCTSAIHLYLSKFSVAPVLLAHSLNEI